MEPLRTLRDLRTERSRKVSLLDRFKAMFSNNIAIDLGTANTLVYVKGQGLVLNEPSVVAVERGTNRVLAVGHEAKAMVGKTPESIEAIRPLKDGVIADFESTEQMLRRFITQVISSRFLVRPRVIISVPSGITEVEKRAVRDSAEQAGAREVFLVPEPIAAAIGVGLPVSKPCGNMVLDIGGGTSEIAVMTLNGIVRASSVRMAGDKMDDAIVQYVKRAYNVLIGEQTAEQIKIRIGSAYPLDPEEEMEVKGRDLIAGIPKSIRVSSEEIREALTEPIEQMIEALRQTLERTPPELAADIADRGIVLTGGGALLRGLDQLLRESTGLNIQIADDPLLCVVLGAGRIHERFEEYDQVLMKSAN